MKQSNHSPPPDVSLTPALLGLREAIQRAVDDAKTKKKLNPKAPKPLPKLSEDERVRFWKKVDRSAGPEACWPWIAGKISSGYGALWMAGRMVRAHRVAFEIEKGPIPQGLVLDHLCRQRQCVNPQHLEPVTHGDNTRRGLVVGGTWNQGEKSGKAKLADSQVHEIRRLYASGLHTQSEVGAMFRVSKSQVRHIVNGTRWAHLKAAKP